MDDALLSDLVAEGDVLDRLVAAADADAWERPTPAAGWTVADQVHHLAAGNRLAARAVRGEPGTRFAGEPTGAPPARAADPGVLLEAWRASRAEVLGARWRSSTPATAVAWGVGEMTARSLATARLMECWAHGLDCHARAALAPVDTDRLRHVAHLAHRALPHAFAVAGEEPPGPFDRLALVLVGPGGEGWRYGARRRDRRVGAGLRRRLVPGGRAPPGAAGVGAHGRRSARRGGHPGCPGLRVRPFPPGPGTGIVGGSRSQGGPMSRTSNGADDRVVTVERVIPAPPERIFEILADPRRHREIDGTGSVQQAFDDSPVRLSLGAKFGMGMKIGLPYRMMNTVIEFEEGRRIAWAPKPVFRGKERPKQAGRIWRYELEPVDGGTRVRETWDATAERGFAIQKLLGANKRSATGMASSLANLERLVA